MAKAITKGTTADTGKNYWKCVSSDCGYRAFGNAQQDWVYRHAAGCEALGRTHPDVRQAIIDLRSRSSLGASVIHPIQQESSSSSSSSSASNSHSELPSPRASPPKKKQNVDGDIRKRVIEGGEAKRREEREKRQQLCDHWIKQLVSVRGLAPDILDSPEWKELMDILDLNPNYNPT